MATENNSYGPSGPGYATLQVKTLLEIQDTLVSTLPMHNMGDGFLSPCGMEPASVYYGYQGGFTTDWSQVDCQKCLQHAGS